MIETNRSFALQSMLSALELLAKEVDVVQKVVIGESPMQYSVVDWHRIFIKVLFGILIVGEANQKGMLPSTSVVQTNLVLKDLSRIYTWKEVQDWIAFVQTGDECTVGLQLGLFKGADWEVITRPSFDSIPMRDVLFHLRSVLETFEVGASSVGLLYEQILQVVPEWSEVSQCYKASVQPDSLRKSTGAFYTPQTLVDVVLNSTIEPLMERCLSLQDPMESIRELAICDPSCGLGYILIAAAKRLTQETLRLNPTVDESETYTFILKHCMYGVDINPLTIDMCKALLWMEAGDPSVSVGTWDDKIRCGNALLGCTPAMVREGITEASFARVLHHDDRTIRRKIASKSRSERRRQVGKSDEETSVDSRDLADTLMASMVWPKIEEGDWYEHAPTFQVFERLRQGTIDPILQQLVEHLKVKHQFFHWHLEFPTIVSRGGFDVVIGNPPFLDSEFLKRTVPYERTAIGNLFESTTGNWDLYIPFTELSLRILKPKGFHAFVTPNKIIGSDYAISLQQHCLLANKIREVHDFSRLFLFGKVRITVVVVAIQKVLSADSDIVQFYQYENQPPTMTLHRQSTIEELRCLPRGYISFPLTSSVPSQLSWMSRPNRLSHIATISDGSSTAEAYLIREFVQNGDHDSWGDEDWIALINTGTIDPYRLQWGEKDIRYLGVQARYPVVHCSDLTRVANKRYVQSLKPSVVVAGMAARLEAAVAPARVMCGKSAVLIQPDEGVCPYALAVLLNSTVFNQLYIGLFAMRALNSQAINIGPRQLELLPVPPLDYLTPYEGDLDDSIDRYSSDCVETSLSYLGQLLHATLPEDSVLRVRQTVEKTVQRLMDV